MRLITIILISFTLILSCKSNQKIYLLEQDLLILNTVLEEIRINSGQNKIAFISKIQEDLNEKELDYIDDGGFVKRPNNCKPLYLEQLLNNKNEVKNLKKQLKNQSHSSD